MQIDPFYGLESNTIESFISDIYKKNSTNALYQQFRSKYSSHCFSSDHQKQLIFLWCGLLDLPIYQNSIILDSQSINYFDPSKVLSFEIKLDELKSFLRSHFWPLPTALFPDDVDNTKRKITLNSEEFNRAFKNHTVLLPKFENELQELINTPATSMAERRQKLDEIEKLESQIKAIHTGEKVNYQNKNEQSVDSTKPVWINIAQKYALKLLANDSSLTVKELTSKVYVHLKKEKIRGRGNKEISKENIRRNALAGIKS